VRGGGRILIIEDEPLIRKLLGIALRRSGHTVHACPDGPTGLRRLRSGRYDLLLTDFRLPGMTGIEVVRAAREKGIEIPVVLMSTSSPEELGVPARERRGFRFLRKPFGLRVLASIIRRTLRGSRRSPSRPGGRRI
jgi:DNA-binding response OmpR family regulator